MSFRSPVAGAVRRAAPALSFALNAALAALVLVLLAIHIPRPPAPDARRMPPDSEAGVVDTNRLPFRWGQIESTDYRAYIANLRGIGCPEQTISDIIAADLHALYQARYDELQRRALQLAEGDRLLVELRAEEGAVLATLLGPAPAGLTPALPARISPREQRAPLPLVFQEMDSALPIDAHQREVMGELRQQFQQALAEAGQDPSSPGYRERWQSAQQESDDLLQGLLGGQFFLDCQIAAADPNPH